jgi:hypothetical protein
MTDEKTTALATSPAPQATSLLNFVAQAVSDPNVDVGKLRALLEMQREIVADEAKSLFNAALRRCQQEMPRVSKLGVIEMGAKGSMPFARWEDIDTALRPIMERHGFSLSFDMEPKEGGGAVVSATLHHEAGHAKTVSMPLALDSGAGRNNLQAMGSTLSYGKRYCTEMLFNIVRVGGDDDGKRGGTRYITPEQKETLVKLLQDTKADTVAFLRYVGVESLDEIEVGAFTPALNSLQAKARQLKGGGQ